MKSFIIATAGAVLLTGCGVLGSPEQDDRDQLGMFAVLALASDNKNSSGGSGTLAQPADDTALMVLNNESLTLTDPLTCASGTTGVGFSMIDADNLPTLFIHNIDFSKTSGVSVGNGGSVLDIDLPAGVANPSGNCAATVLATTAAIYDLQVLNCALTNGSSVSFRARCTP